MRLYPFQNDAFQDNAFQQEGPPIVLMLSGNFADGDPTTAQLTPPGAKTTDDFQAGKMSESSNPIAAIDLDADKYTEIEFCIQATDDAENDAVYEFRITDNGVVLDTYSQIPEWITPPPPSQPAFLLNFV